MSLSSNTSRLLPEQVWDAADIPDRELFFGKASGSACPLVWAHSEYIKLVRSLKDGKIFDQPPQTVKRYRVEKRKAVYWEWRFNNKCRIVPVGKTLRIATQAPALVHWSHDGWQTSQDVTARDTGLGIYVADLPTSSMDAGHALLFTFYWPEAHRWEGADFSVNIQD
jgi:glucoamylase